MKSDTYCVATHACMSIQNNADYCSCNLNKNSWKTDEHEVMFVPNHSPQQAWGSYTRKIISTVLDHNQRHPSCQVCWDIEDAGGTSARMLFNSEYPELTPLDQPQILVIKPGNTCNLACRMCNPATSSSWYADAYKLENPNTTFQEYTRQFEIIRNSFNKHNDQFWGSLRTWMPNMKLIDIYGGEPFLAPGMFELLKYGVDTGACKNISLQLHTNATIFNQRYIDILAQYKSVHFRMSFDSAVAEQNNYIRYPSEFTETVENTRRFRDFFRDYRNVTVGITTTVTSLNVYYIDTIMRDLEQLLEMEVGNPPNLVTDSEYDVRHLPIPVKDLLKKHIKNPTLVSFLEQTIPGCDIEWPKFCRVTDRLDQLRGQSFAGAFPEWWSILEPHWVK